MNNIFVIGIYIFVTPSPFMQEMLKMLHYDALHYPSDNQIPPDTKTNKKRKLIPGPETHANFLKLVPYEELEPEDYQEAADLIEMETERLKACTDHGQYDYSHIVNEVSNQLIFLPSQSNWTRNSVASRKERLESCEVRLSTNKAIMTRLGKTAARTEKKLKVLTAGYEKRNEQLAKELTATGEKVQSTIRDIRTFQKLSLQEKENGDLRVKKEQEHYKRQLDRHLVLQKEFDQLSHKLKAVGGEHIIFDKVPEEQ